MVNKYLDILHSRPLSWSSVASFEYDKEKWFEERILGNKKSSPELEFGSLIDKKIQDDPSFLPHLPRYEKMQYRIKVNMGGLELVGVLDGLNLDKCKEICDYKSGRVKWTQQRAQETGQLKFYLLLLYIAKKIDPNDFTCYIHWIETKKTETGDFKVNIDFVKEGTFQTFKVRHTMREILSFAVYLKNVYKEMEDYLKNHD